MVLEGCPGRSNWGRLRPSTDVHGATRCCQDRFRAASRRHRPRPWRPRAWSWPSSRRARRRDARRPFRGGLLGRLDPRRQVARLGRIRPDGPALGRRLPEGVEAVRGAYRLVLSVAVDKDGQKILSGGLDKTAKVWDLPAVRPFEDPGRPPGRRPSVRPQARRQADRRRLGEAGPGLGSRGRRSRSATWPATPRTSSPSPGERTATRSPRATRRRPIRLWDAATGAPQGTIETPGRHRPRPGLSARQPADRLRRLRRRRPALEAPGGDAKAEPVRTFAGQKGPILAVALDPGGGKLVTGSADKTAKVFEVGTGKDLLTLEGHGDAVRAVAVTRRTARRSSPARPTGRSGSGTSPTASSLPTYPALPGPVASLAVGGDSKTLLVGLADGSARVFDLSAADPAKAERQAIAAPGRPDHGGRDPARRRDPADRPRKTGRSRPGRSSPRGPSKTFAGHGSQVYSVAWSPDATEGPDRLGRRQRPALGRGQGGADQGDGEGPRERRLRRRLEPEGGHVRHRRRRQARQVLGPGRGQGTPQGRRARRGRSTAWPSGPTAPSSPRARSTRRSGSGTSPTARRPASSTATPTTSTASPSAPTASGSPRSATPGTS